MEFRQPNSSTTNDEMNSAHKSLLVPRRSLMIMSGESRYGWTHGITPRKIDVFHNAAGHLTTMQRSTRVSFTFRWLASFFSETILLKIDLRNSLTSRLKYDGCNCSYPLLCDTQLSRDQQKSTMNNTVASPSQLELENVHNVYDEIASHFSETRHSPWPQVEEFVQLFAPGSVLIDVGCGNGKYLHLNSGIVKVRIHSPVETNSSYIGNVFPDRMRPQCRTTERLPPTWTKRVSM